MARPKEKKGGYMNYEDDESLGEKKSHKEKFKTGGAHIKDGRASKSASARSKSTQSPSGYKSSYIKPKVDFRDPKFDNTLSSGGLPKYKSIDGRQSKVRDKEKEKQYAKQNGNKGNLFLKNETTDDSFQSESATPANLLSFKSKSATPPYDFNDRPHYSGRQKQITKKQAETEKMPAFKKNVAAGKRETKRDLQIKAEPIDEKCVSVLMEKPKKRTEKESYLLTSVPQNKSPKHVNSLRYLERKAKRHFLTVIIMNASGPSGDNGPEPAPRRKQTILDVINKFSPDIVLFQEFTWKTIRGANWGNFSLPDRYHFSGHEHAALLIDESQFEFKDFLSGKVDSLISRTLKKMKKYKLPIDQNEFAPRARMAMRRFEKKRESSSQEVIVISWHGRSNKYDGGGLTIDFKVYLFRYLFEFLNQIKEEFKLPIIIGGDFNIEKDYIEEYVTKPFKLISYTSSDRRSKGGTKDVIDYFIATDDLVVSGARYIDLEKTSTAKNPNQVLDHDPIIANVDLSF